LNFELNNSLTFQAATCLKPGPSDEENIGFMKIHITLLLLGLSLNGLLADNGRQKPVLSPGLQASHEAYPVKGRNGFLLRQKFSFGGYRTTSVRHGALRKVIHAGGIPGLFWAEHTQGKQSLRFQLEDGQGQHSEVYCLTQLRQEDFTLGANPNSIINILGDLMGLLGRGETNFSAAIFLGEDNQPWELFLNNLAAESNTSEAVGYLRRGETIYHILPLREIWRKGRPLKALGTVGLEFRDAEGQAVAAVSLIDRGEVFLSAADREDRFLLANACSALLLQQYVE
jgi:hypothetical protein